MESQDGDFQPRSTRARGKGPGVFLLTDNLVTGKEIVPKGDEPPPPPHVQVKSHLAMGSLLVLETGPPRPAKKTAEVLSARSTRNQGLRMVEQPNSARRSAHHSSKRCFPAEMAKPTGPNNPHSSEGLKEATGHEIVQGSLQDVAGLGQLAPPFATQASPVAKRSSGGTPRTTWRRNSLFRWHGQEPHSCGMKKIHTNMLLPGHTLPGTDEGVIAMHPVAGKPTGLWVCD
mmetsp:Transcript_43758/g.103383  ORF Transcript_43758/g.103383 Transcript_43758/m.103383 type:complete len:230 (+) Transcript_43758:49-738(+)